MAGGSSGFLEGLSPLAYRSECPKCWSPNYQIFGLVYEIMATLRDEISSVYLGIPSMATTPNFTCVICCGIITDASFIVNCGHEFCQRCILRWLNEEHNTCPICRGPASGGLRPCPLVRKIVTKMKSKHPNKDMDPNDEMEIVMEVINEEIEKEMYHLHLKYPSTSNNTAN